MLFDHKTTNTTDKHLGEGLLKVFVVMSFPGIIIAWKNVHFCVLIFTFHESAIAAHTVFSVLFCCWVERRICVSITILMMNPVFVRKISKRNDRKNNPRTISRAGLFFSFLSLSLNLALFLSTHFLSLQFFQLFSNFCHATLTRLFDTLLEG